MTFDEVRGTDDRPLLAAWATSTKPSMLLTSAHNEAYEDVGITGFTSAERQANYIWLATQLNAVMGTSFHVPAPGSEVRYLNASRNRRRSRPAAP